MSEALLLVEHADLLVTMDETRSEIRDGAVLVQGGRIVAVGTTAQVRERLGRDFALPGRIVSARGCVLVPGLVNCHHHLFQSLTRAIGTGAGKSLFDWLRMLYRVWAALTPEALQVSTRVALSELMLSGATTVADHLYLFPNGCRLDDTIEAAVDMGIRFHPTRGSMSIGQSAGGLPPDDLVEDEAAILRDSQRLIERWHDPADLSMISLGLAPCSPFSASEALMRETARLARSHRRVGLHTHLAETRDEHRYCVERFGLRPVELAESLEWLGPDVWFAHMVHPDAADIQKLGGSRSGVCHCPGSNMILASGIAPVRAMIDAGVRVGIGVDGSASNDSNDLLGEARLAMLLQRVGWPGFESDAARMPAREALYLATRGGALALGRDDIGSIAAGKAADVVAFRVDGLMHAGALGDPAAALLTCAPAKAWFSAINGRVVVEDGRLAGVDTDALVVRHNDASRRILEKAGLMG